MLISYVLLVISMSCLGRQIYYFNKSKKIGQTIIIQPLYMLAYIIILITALVSIMTGQTYEEIIDFIEQLVR